MGYAADPDPEPAASTPVAASVAALNMVAERYLEVETPDSHKMTLEIADQWAFSNPGPYG